MAHGKIDVAATRVNFVVRNVGDGNEPALGGLVVITPRVGEEGCGRIGAEETVCRHRRCKLRSGLAINGQDHIDDFQDEAIAYA